MKRLVSLALLALALVSSTALSQGTQDIPGADQQDGPIGLEGTFCSAATSDGYWAFYYGLAPIRENCQAVRAGLASVTRAPITASNYGFYLPQGWNEAVVQCGLIRSHFYGDGGYPLQRAYNYARLIGGQGCIFEVYY